MNDKKRLVNCIVSGTIRHIRPDQEIKGRNGTRKFRLIQVEMFNDDRGQYDDVNVMEFSDVTAFRKGDEISVPVNVGVEVFEM